MKRFRAYPIEFLSGSLILLAIAVVGIDAEEFRPNLGPDLPRITVTCGEVTLLLRQSSQWTPGRIDFRGTPMTTEQSAYGTVISIPDVGFIGTAHLENEPEDLKALAFFLDDQPVAAPDEALAGESFRLVRESRIRTFGLRSEIELKADRLYETTTLTADEATPLKVVYHFMHAWTPSVSAVLAGTDAEPDAEISQQLLDGDDVTRKFYVNRRVDWVAVYEPKSGHFAVSQLLEAPELGGHESKVWNIPGVYRKFYLACFQNETVPAGFAGTWRMVTGFGQSEPGSWEDAARELARELREIEE